MDDFAELIEILESADREPIGLELEFESEDEVRIYRAHLYKVRRELDAYSHLSMIDRGNKLWIVHNVKAPS